jgi:hypothetical protein
VCAAALAGFVREERGVHAAKDDVRASGARDLSDAVAPQRVAGVNADSDHVARLDRVFRNRLQCFVDEDRCPVTHWCRRGENVLPARRDDGRPKRHVARIDEMNAHRCL